MAEAYGHATLGNYTFRLDPDAISYDYQIDYSVINTLGGQVVQVLGATIGDITIRGSFGQDHKNKRESWQMAETFHANIKAMMDAQTLSKQGPAHAPLRFTYMDGVHNWDFSVLIKGVTDPGGDGSIEHVAGKFSYDYVLTLFLVTDNSLSLKRVTTDQFISRIANGLGWKRSSFNGSNTIANAVAFIQAQGGNFADYYVKLLEGASAGTGNTAASTPATTTDTGGKTTKKGATTTPTTAGSGGSTDVGGLITGGN